MKAIIELAQAIEDSLDKVGGFPSHRRLLQMVKVQSFLGYPEHGKVTKACVGYPKDYASNRDTLR